MGKDRRKVEGKTDYQIAKIGDLGKCKSSDFPCLAIGGECE
jgi:hypothetical protein